MNTIEALLTIKEHLIKQNRPSVDSNGKCMYRGEDGTKCAIGCLIPDHLYNKSMEHKPVDQIAHLLTEVLPPDSVDIVALMEAQFIHDRRHPEYWASEMKRLIERHS